MTMTNTTQTQAPHALTNASLASLVQANPEWFALAKVNRVIQHTGCYVIDAIESLAAYAGDDTLAISAIWNAQNLAKIAAITASAINSTTN